MVRRSGLVHRWAPAFVAAGCAFVVACSDSSGDDGSAGGAPASPGGASGSSPGGTGASSGASAGTSGAGGEGAAGRGGADGASGAGAGSAGAAGSRNDGGASGSGGTNGGSGGTNGGSGGTNGGGAGTGGAAGAGAGAGKATSGCGKDPPAEGERSLMLDGMERTYVLDLPPDYDTETPYPLVFGFHGASTSGATFRSSFYGNLLSTLETLAIVVHPDALGEPTSWDTERDVPFFDALVEALSGELCLDEGRIFATGHSSGGFFTNALGCERGDVLRGIAPVSGGGPFAFGGASCTGQVAAWIAHGENDETVDFSSGEGSRDHWLEANGCGETSAAVTPPECVTYQGCNDGYPVHWCVYQDGHDWPDFGPEGIASFFLELAPE